MQTMSERTIPSEIPSNLLDTEDKRSWDWGLTLVLLSVASVFLGSTLVALNLSFFQLYPLRLFGIIGLVFLLTNHKSRDPFLTFIFRYTVFFLLFGFFSILWAPNTVLAIKEFGILQTGLTFTWLICRYVDTEERIELVIAIWVVGAIFVNLIGLWEVVNQQFLIKTEVGAQTERAIARIGFLAPRGIFNNQNNYAFFNGITSLILLGRLIKKYQPTYLYILNVLSFGLSFFLLVCSYSRAAIGGFTIASAFFLLFIFFSKNSVKSNLVNIILLSFAAFIALIIISPSTIESFSDKLFLVVEKNNIRTEEGRSNLYTASLAYAYESLGIGRGPGASINNLGGLPPHNYFLQILIDYGILIVLLQLWILCRVFKRLGNYKHIIHNAMPPMMQASILAFPLLSIGPSSIVGEGVFWLWLGVIIAYSSISIRKYFDLK
ncbi:O-antigen ligase family protein [Pontibacter sp. BT731]|uniref:O-antigen ligase family protein n=1 Tax=Pontibacter coccineus TaxID=3063328 RepID=UPI0026E1A10D|nr:O-antigen ligase family protein [Pontibacter sp. BT731]MDO6390988.1 O-antigen ligase family protein [Pontibacter sp. BT731]